MTEKTDAILEIDEEFADKLTADEARELKRVQKRFVESYLKHRNRMNVEEWLNIELAESLPEYQPEAITKMSNDIISTLKLQEEKKRSLQHAIENGRSKESWFASDVKKATAHMTTQEAAKYLQGLDDAVKEANRAMLKTAQTQSGMISQNPNLDGFMAEQYHAQTFNLNAKAAESSSRAKVLEPNGHGYGKNSMDIGTYDGNGKLTKRYQAKYGKDSKHTQQAFENHDYRGQGKLVPKGQEANIDKNVNTVLEAPDGITSNPLSKERAKKMQEDAQSGNWQDLDWNEYKVKDLAKGVGKHAGQAALMGAAVGTGFNLAQKAWNGDKIEGEELVEAALTTGADAGIKAATAGALKVGAEKGILQFIPKGTPAGTIANIVNIGIENTKILGHIAAGDLAVGEGLEKIEETTVSSVAGIAASGIVAGGIAGTATTTAAIAAIGGGATVVGGGAMAAGATIGTVLGPVGTAIGAAVGGAVAYMAGSKVGEVAVKTSQKVRKKAVETIKNIGGKVVDAVTSIKEGILNFFGI